MIVNRAAKPAGQDSPNIIPCRAAERMLAEYRQPHRAAADQPRRTPGAVDQRLAGHEPLAGVVRAGLDEFRRLARVEQVVLSHPSVLRPSAPPSVRGAPLAAGSSPRRPAAPGRRTLR